MLIYAHRGASYDFPEMSLAAYTAAIAQGADGFECDIRLTKDGVIICWHDDDFLRIANSPLVVAKSTHHQLHSEYPVLAFEKLLNLAIKNKKNLAIETKHPVPTSGEIESALLKMLEAKKSEIQVSGIQIAIMSFSWLATWRVRKSGWDCVYLVAHPISRFFAITPILGPWVALLRDKPNKFAGKRLFVWTVNEEPEIRAMLNRDIEVLITDRPGYAREIINQK